VSEPLVPRDHLEPTDHFGASVPVEPDHPDPPDWLVPEPYADTDLGVLKTGKEAQVSLVERVDFLHRDVVNITAWIARQGLERDAEELFATLLGELTW